MRLNRIFILGTSGSGKTELAKKLSEMLKIKTYDLDEIEWKNKYSKRRETKNKMKILNGILKRKKWIIEGAYTHWTEKAVKKSGSIIWLDLPFRTIKYRLIKRFVINRSKMEKIRLKELRRLIRSAKAYCDLRERNMGYKNHKELASKNKPNLIVLKNKSEVKKFIQRIK